MTKTITRLFDNYSDAQSAVTALEGMGISHDDISILANNGDNAHTGSAGDGANPDHDGDVSRGASTGAALGGVGGLLAGLGLLAIPGLGPIVAAGWLAATAAGVGLGAAGGAATGTIVGALKNAGHTEEEANVYSEGLRRGGTLVSARVRDEMASRVETLLHSHRAVDASTRGATYRESGWSRFDETAPAYTGDQIARERSAYSTAPVI